MDTSERKRIFQDSIVALGENFYDTLAAPELLQNNSLITEEVVQGQGSLADVLQELGQGGQGVLILTGHLGCWELLGGWLTECVAAAGLGQLAVVTGSIHNAPVDRLIQKRRQKLGMKILPRDQGAAPLLRHLRSGGVVAVLLDQNTRVENLPIPFFGQEAPTPVGFARIALRYGIPIVPVVLAKSGSGHQVRRAAAQVPEAVGQDSEEALKELLLWCNQKLENFIRRNPIEWVWFHQRWS
jgi:Kdo2-lipid IVA lauroyltransferase/acyltransferase